MQKKWHKICTCQLFVVSLSPQKQKTYEYLIGKMSKKNVKIVLCLVAILVLTIIAVIGCNMAVMRATEGKMYDDAHAIPFNRVGVLLGTSPVGRYGNANPFYTNRIHACAELYKAGKIQRVLISGDNSRKEYDEPTWTKEDLIKLGIPDSAIYLDYAGFRTLDSMVRAKEVFGLNAFTIISQPFHNERALYITSHKDIDAIAFNAGDVRLRRWQLRMTVREWLARTKAVLDIHTGKQPHFLGEQIEIK